MLKSYVKAIEERGLDLHSVSVDRCEAQVVMDLAWEHLDPDRL